MSLPSTQLVMSREMGICAPLHQVCMWSDTFRGDDTLNHSPPTFLPVSIVMDNSNSELIPNAPTLPSGSDQEADKPVDKVKRRLAQNREAARRSRLRKKAYVKQLETSRMKLIQLEMDIQKTRKQSLYLGRALDASHMGISGTLNKGAFYFKSILTVEHTGVAVFENDYGHWVEEQNRQNSHLRNALQAHLPDLQLHILVENCLKHYGSLLRMKAEAAKSDVFYVISGAWRTPLECFFLWIGGPRPSELLNVVLPQLEPPLTEQQLVSIKNLRHSTQQAEDALSQGWDKLQQVLAQSIAVDAILAEDYRSQTAASVDKEALEGFVNQADHLRQQSLQHMSRILTTRQAARGLLALGEYFQRLRGLSSLWGSRTSKNPSAL